MSFNPEGFYLERQYSGIHTDEKNIQTTLITFKKELSIIGKGPDVNIDLMRNLDHKQCEIFFKDGNTYLRNLATRGGTWINGNKIVDSREMTFLRLGDLIGLGVDPLDTTKDRNTFYVYKVCKEKVVATYEISDSDDDEGVDVGNNSPITSDGPSTSSAAAHRDARRKSIEKFSIVDFDEADNEPKTDNSSVVEIDLDMDAVNEAMSQINEAFFGVETGTADNDATEILPPPSTSTPQTHEVNEKQENLKKLAQEAKDKFEKLNKIAKMQKVPIIDAQRMTRKRGYREEPTSTVAIASTSTAPATVKFAKKRGRKSNKERELLKLRSQKLSGIATANPRPEKKRREIDNPVRAKVTAMNRSDSLIADMINPADIKGN